MGELIHSYVQEAIETTAHAKLAATLGGAARYEPTSAHVGRRTGTTPQVLPGPTSLLALTLPCGSLRTPVGPKAWRSTSVPRYQRRMREVNEPVVAIYLAGGDLRRIRGARRPLFKAAPLSKRAISPIVATLRVGLDAWQSRPLANPEVVCLYLHAIALYVRRVVNMVSQPILRARAALADGQKQLLALELCGEASLVS